MCRYVQYDAAQRAWATISKGKISVGNFPTCGESIPSSIPIHFTRVGCCCGRCASGCISSEGQDNVLFDLGHLLPPAALEVGVHKPLARRTVAVGVYSENPTKYKSTDADVVDETDAGFVYLRRYE